MLSSETTPNFNETALAQEAPLEAPLTDIPHTPTLEEQSMLPQLLEVGAHSHAATARLSVNEKSVLKEPGETEATIELPRKVSRRKRATQASGEVAAQEATLNGVAEVKSGHLESSGTEETIRLPDAVSRQQHTAVPTSSEVETTIRLPGGAGKRREKARQRSQAEAETTIQLPGGAGKRREKARQRSQAEAETTMRLPGKASKRQQARLGARESLERDLQSFEDTHHDDSDEEGISRHDTWHTEVPQKPSRPMPVVSGVPARPKFAPAWFSALNGSRATRSFFWLSTVLLIALLLSGAFGIAVSLARTTRKAVPNPPPALQASPATIALGGIITLRGEHFTPGGNVTLSRDQHVALPDTGGVSTIQADAQGLFGDTVVADPLWLAGTHTLYATDVRTHKQALVPVIVTGENALQGPPHLLLSSSELDLGSGDEVTNASKLLALSNAGGGQATWQASTSQSWLQVTPQSGSVATGKHMAVIVAADRSTLAPGSYHATVVFTSSTGQITLPVSLQVTALQPGHEAIMEVSPATLAFEGVARGQVPGQRTITINNPGSQPLVWGADVHGAGWLWAAPAGGTIPAGGQQQVTVGVTTDALASGVYKGVISFVNQGSQPVQGSPQSVYISLTITPACTLALSTSSLSFSGQHDGSSPLGKSVNIGVAQGCKTSQNWTDAVSTSSGGNWLHVSSAKGKTPGVITVSVDTTGLVPGVYKGTLIVTSSLGSKLLSVTLTVTPVPCAVSGTSALTMQGTAGQTSLVTQNAILNSAGDCTHTLSWTSVVSDSSWLSASSGGSFTSSATLKIQSNLANLSAGTYTGTVKITVLDSVTNQSIGTVVVSVTLTVQPPTPPANPCALQGPSSTGLSFAAKAGSDPATPVQNVTISVTGNCSGTITITPSGDAASSGWLSVSGAATIASGSTATFTVTVSSAKLAAGTYTGTVTLTASNGLPGSPRTVTVTLVVQ